VTRQQIERECPKCKSTLTARATYCGCGWKAETRRSAPEKSTGIGDCAWLANGEQCHYPGTSSHNTQGLGPWYCRFHAAPDVSQHYGEQVVIQSRNYRLMTMQERDAQHLARLKDPDYKPKFRACEERSCIVGGTLQPNGKYLCYKHKKTPESLQYAKQGLRPGMVSERVSLRQPGDDDEVVAA